MTPSIEDARKALYTKVQQLASTWTEYTLAIEYGNQMSINLASQANPYLCVQLVVMDGQQTSLGYNAMHRVMGNIIVEAKMKEGSGEAQANRLLAHFYPALQMKDNIPPLRTYAARMATKPAKQGWAAQAAIIPFWFDSAQA